MECNILCDYGLKGSEDKIEYNIDKELFITNSVLVHIELINQSENTSTNISVSHIKRVGGTISQSSINCEKGKVDLIYDVLKWKINTLNPGEKTVLKFKYLIEDCEPFSITPLKVSYDYYFDKNYFGPFDSNRLFIICSS